MRLHVLAMVIAVSMAPGCRRDKPGVSIVEMSDGATFEVPVALKELPASGGDKRSFVVRAGVRLDVDQQAMKEDCQSRLAWIEQQTRAEIKTGRVEAEGEMQRLTLGGNQVIRARLVTVPAPDNRVDLFHTEMIGVCGDGAFVVFQIAYRGDADPALSRLLTGAAKSLRY